MLERNKYYYMNSVKSLLENQQRKEHDIRSCKPGMYAFYIYTKQCIKTRPIEPTKYTKLDQPRKMDQGLLPTQQTDSPVNSHARDDSGGVAVPAGVFPP